MWVVSVTGCCELMVDNTKIKYVAVLSKCESMIGKVRVTFQVIKNQSRVWYVPVQDV